MSLVHGAAPLPGQNPMEVDESLFTGESVPVKFFTTTFETQMPKTTFYMPVKVTLTALSEFVNATLGLTPATPFNFLVNNEFVRFASLDKWMKKKGISKENTLELEYTPAFEVEAGNNLPHDDWVAAIRRLPIPSDPSADPADHPYLTVSYDKCWRLWKGEDCLYVGAGHRSAIKSVSIISAAEGETGKRKRDAVECKFVTGAKDGNVFVWQFSGGVGKELHKLEHPESVDSVAVHMDKSLLCTGGWDKLLRIWTLDRLEEDLQVGAPGRQQYLHCSLAGHSRAIFATAWSEEKRARLMSTGLDGTVRVWDVIKQAPLMNLREECFAAYCMAVRGQSGGDRVITGHVDGKVRLWDTRSPTVCNAFPAHKGFVYGVTWNAFPGEGISGGGGASGGLFTSVSEDRDLHVWDLRGRTPLATLSEHSDGVLCVEWMGQGTLLTGSKDSTVKSSRVKFGANSIKDPPTVAA
jgi:ribosome biogenesis protein YTM1